MAVLLVGKVCMAEVTAHQPDTGKRSLRLHHESHLAILISLKNSLGIIALPACEAAIVFIPLLAACSAERRQKAHTRSQAMPG